MIINVGDVVKLKGQNGRFTVTNIYKETRDRTLCDIAHCKTYNDDCLDSVIRLFGVDINSLVLS